MEDRKSIVERWKTDSIPTSAVSQCSLCKHRHKSDSCDAYPDGIPMEISHNKKIHRESLGDDYGITFEPISPKYENVDFKPFGKKKLY